MAEITPMQASFAELNKAIQIADYKQVLKAANKILHSKDGNTDVKAMQCKVIAFIHMDMFSDALNYIDQNQICAESLVFEKAYCQYRLQQTEKALDTLEESPHDDIRIKDLKAQILYKLGYYGDSHALYRQLIKECADDYEEERKTNFMAAQSAQALWDGTAQVDIGLEADSYEQMYNRACLLIGANKYDEAMNLLNQSIEACKETFAEDDEATEDEIESEIAVMRVQQGFVLQLQGKNDEALSIYNQVIKSRPSDIALVAVASNNIISINGEQNVFDSKKKLRATMVQGVEAKLTKTQLQKIEFNRVLLHMYSNQWEQCRKLLKTLQRRYKDSDIPCLIQAAQYVREKNFDKAISYLKEFIEQYSDPDISNLDLTNVKLALVQILMSQKRTSEATSVMSSLGGVSNSLAFVSTLVGLKADDDPDAVIKILDDAIAWHKKNGSDKVTIGKLLWESSQWLLKNKHPKRAAEKLEELRLQDSNVKILAQLIFAYSQFNQEKAHQISEDLPSLEEMSVDVNVDELERTSSLFTPRYVKRQAKLKQKAGDNEPEKKSAKMSKEVVSENREAVELKVKKKKKKKNPPPKNLDPSAGIDPERWLPLRERSYYKGRRKDRRKVGVGKGTQGSAAGASDAYDITKTSTQTPASPKPGSAVNSPKPNATASVKPKAAQAKQKPNKKKKKKGSGW